MGGHREKARSLLQQVPGRVERHANAADISHIKHGQTPDQRPFSAWGLASDTGDPFATAPVGGDTRALVRMGAAAGMGCGPIAAPVRTPRERGALVEARHDTARKGGDA